MAEGRKFEAWKQITWLRAAWSAKPAPELDAWNPLIAAGGNPSGAVPLDADTRRAIGRALEMQQNR